MCRRAARQDDLKGLELQRRRLANARGDFGAVLPRVKGVRSVYRLKVIMREKSLLGAVVPLVMILCGCHLDAVPVHRSPALDARRETVPALEGRDGILRPIGTIGELEGPAEYLLGHVADATVGADGEVLILDADRDVVNLYDRTGSFVRTISRPGRGPGEFGDPNGVAFTADGRILIADRGRRAVHRFSRDGVYELSWPLPGLPDLPVQVDGVGNAYVRLQGDQSETSRWSANPASVSQEYNYVYIRHKDQITNELLRLNPDGTTTRIGAPDVVDTSPRREGTETVIHVGIDYAPQGWWAIVPPARIIVGDTRSTDIDVFSIRWSDSNAPYTPNGKLRLEQHDIPIDEGERNLVQHQVEQFRASSLQAGELSGSFDVPRVKPAYRRVIIGQDGALWVMRYAPSRRLSGRGLNQVWGEIETRFDLFHPDGTYRGTTTGPAGLRPLSAYGDTLLVRNLDDLDVQSVGIYVVDWK